MLSRERGAWCPKRIVIVLHYYHWYSAYSSYLHYHSPLPSSAAMLRLATELNASPRTLQTAEARSSLVEALGVRVWAFRMHKLLVTSRCASCKDDSRELYIVVLKIPSKMPVALTWPQQQWDDDPSPKTSAWFHAWLTCAKPEEDTRFFGWEVDDASLSRAPDYKRM